MWTEPLLLWLLEFGWSEYLSLSLRLRSRSRERDREKATESMNAKMKRIHFTTYDLDMAFVVAGACLATSESSIVQICHTIFCRICFQTLMSSISLAQRITINVRGKESLLQLEIFELKEIKIEPIHWALVACKFSDFQLIHLIVCCYHCFAVSAERKFLLFVIGTRSNKTKNLFRKLAASHVALMKITNNQFKQVCIPDDRHGQFEY